MVRKIKRFSKYFRMNAEDEKSLGGLFNRKYVYCFLENGGIGTRFSLKDNKMTKDLGKFNIEQMVKWKNIEITRQEAEQIIPALPFS